MKKQILIAIFAATQLFFAVHLSAQMGINADNSVPDNSAMLDVKSNSKGMLIPRMTQNQISAITTPANGLFVFCTTDDKFYAYVASANVWKEILYGSGTIAAWTCGNPMTDNRDSKTYNTVQISTQCWMAQNLNIGTMILSSSEQTNNGVDEKYCYNDLESNCTIYGGLYQWNELMQYITTPGVQGLCPSGFHIPTDVEWANLQTYLGGETVSGGKMKETGTIHWNSPNTGATNESGFTGLGGGFRNMASTFYYLTIYGEWGSSTQFDGTTAWIFFLNYNNTIFGSMHDHFYHGYSVRCIKD